MNYTEGIVLNIDKPYGWSSTDVVRKLKHALYQSGNKKVKIGHAGTLDPLATGVLLVCIGKATKRVVELQAQEKEYIFTVELGATTPSYDLEHPIDHQFPYEHITKEMVHKYLDSIQGEQEQLPPLYSAKRVAGKRAYEYMREGKQVELKTATITIYEAEVRSFELPHVEVRVACSKGTYIRSIARDMGLELNSGGHITALRRTRSGEFNEQNIISLESALKQIAEQILEPTV